MDNLEKQFNLAENNPDQGGGILYSMRYSKDHIEEHHMQVVEALKRIGVTFKDEGERIAVTPEKELSPEEQRRTLALLEELSVINEAREYKETGLDNIQNISDLKNCLILSFHALLDAKNLVDAYNFVTLFIPRIVSDIRLADKQNQVLSAQDRKDVNELAAFAAAKEKMLNKHRIVIMGGPGS